MEVQALFDRVILAEPYPLLFATVSGAHLYGFASADSDFDFRGAHLLPLRKVLGFQAKDETLTKTQMVEGAEVDLVTHDVHKFFSMILKPNGYVMEQIFSPLVLFGGEDLTRLRTLAKGCLTRQHAQHYLGFARRQWNDLTREPEPRVKTLLYLYRVLLTGIHLMRTGEVLADLSRLKEEASLPGLDDLIAQKRDGQEKGVIKAPDLAFHERATTTLADRLRQAQLQSSLPGEPTASADLEDFLVALRMRGL